MDIEENNTAASRTRGNLRYVITVASAELRKGFASSWTILDRKQGLYYSFRNTFDEPSYPRIATTLVMAVRSLRNYPPASCIVLVPKCTETECVNSLYELWKQGSETIYAHEDYCYWNEIFTTLGLDSVFVSYADLQLPTVVQCRRMLPRRT